MVSHHDKTQEIKQHVAEHVKVLIIQRTFWESDIARLLEIPKGSRVLVVNDSAMNTTQTANSLNNLNLDNITLVPYIRESEDRSISIAVTPDEEEAVPPYIQKIINIGNRHLDIGTFLDIIYCMQIYDDRTLSALVHYCGRTINDSMGIKAQYRDAAAANMQMRCLLKHINQGVLVTSPEGLIALSNQYMENLMSTPIADGKLTLARLFGDALAAQMLALDHDTLTATIHSREVIIQHEVEDYGGEQRNIYYFSDVTYIHSLENSIKRKVEGHGFVAKLTFDDAIYHSQAMSDCIATLKLFAPSEKTVLIQGESGTGKELLAQSLHNGSPRKVYPFVAVNCAALSSSLLESELFGYEKGAFTGARQSGKPGLFEQAHNGSIFLDEIGDMPLALQTRLLRVLQERQVMRLGSDSVISVNVRVIAATNQDLKKKMETGEFRSDLYYRLNVLPVSVPPLRQRNEDILPLFCFFTREKRLPEEIRRDLLAYEWPGNVRELQNAADYYTMMKGTAHPLPSFVTRTVRQPPPGTLRQRILGLLSESQGIGRSRLRALLCNEEPISEYTLRGILEEMQQEGLVQIRPGRGGTIATKRGKTHQ